MQPLQLWGGLVYLFVCSGFDPFVMAAPIPSPSPIPIFSLTAASLGVSIGWSVVVVVLFCLSSVRVSIYWGGASFVCACVVSPPCCLSHVLCLLLQKYNNNVEAMANMAKPTHAL